MNLKINIADLSGLINIRKYIISGNITSFKGGKIYLDGIDKYPGH